MTIAIERAPGDCQSLPVLLVALMGAGCANTIAAYRPLSESATAEINETLDGRSAKVMLAEGKQIAGQPIEAREVRVGIDTARWLEPSTDESWRPTAVPTTALKSISVRRHGRGALDGLGLGTLSGAIVGAVAGAAASRPCANETEMPCFGAGIAAIGGGILGFASGALVGSIIGAIVGHRTLLDFDPPPPERLPRNAQSEYSP